MSRRTDAAAPLSDRDLDAAAGGLKEVFMDGIRTSFEPVTLERGLRSDGELVQAVSEPKR